MIDPSLPKVENNPYSTPLEKKRAMTLEEEKNMYSKEEKEKLAKYMQYFAKQGDKNERAKA